MLQNMKDLVPPTPPPRNSDEQKQTLAVHCVKYLPLFLRLSVCGSAIQVSVI